ncbi:TRAP transporter small permease [Castellaniella sp.]|uniref:TRAP transporter small permease n=1 Tax=Castellaniella sp. TaxID=1955812 RepID=UPI0035667C3F
MLRKFDQLIVVASSALLVLLLLLMTGATLSGVFARYLLNDAPAWSEEVARYSMVWLSFLGGGLVFRHGGHIAIDMLIRKIPGRFWQNVVFGFSQLVIFAFLAVLLWKGWDMYVRGGRMTTPALQLPMALPYAAVPVGAALMIYHLMVVSFLSYRGLADPAHAAQIELKSE